MIDLGPAAQRVADLLAHVDDRQLGDETPCPDATVGDLIDHVGMIATGFTASAEKQRSTAAGPPPRPSRDNLEPGWRDRISRDLGVLAAAWREPAAWDGITSAGGIELPAGVVGVVALDELVVHAGTSRSRQANAMKPRTTKWSQLSSSSPRSMRRETVRCSDPWSRWRPKPRRSID